MIATDSSGEETLSPIAKLKVDGIAAARERSGISRACGSASASTTPLSGARARRTVISFGDGSSARRQVSVVHRYRSAGRYLITVRCADKAGNHAVDHIWVAVA